jgi:hypothetical protein
MKDSAGNGRRTATLILLVRAQAVNANHPSPLRPEPDKSHYAGRAAPVPAEFEKEAI